MKLGNFFAGNVFTISQSPHGVNTGGKSIDCVPTSGNRVLAPCDMDIYMRYNNLGSASHSYARGDGFVLEFVHMFVEKSGFVKEGTDIGYLCPTVKNSTGKIIHAMHLHVTIKVNGVWDIVLNYMKRTIQLALAPGFASQHWKSWSTWKDLQLNPVTNPNWTIPRSAYDTGKAQFQPFVERRRPDLIKAGVDMMEWLVMHGSAELPAEMERLYTMVTQLEKVVATQNGTIDKLNASIGGLTTDRNKYATMVEDLNTRLREEADLHEKYVKELNLKYSTQQQQLINCEDDREPLLKKVEDLESKLTTANAELDKAAQIISKLIQDNKGVKIDWGSYINKIIRAIKSFIARNARDNS